jgi:hypothetical protein
VYICFLPGAEQVDAPFGLAEPARGAGVQVQTERASVEHRAADLDQLDQPLVEPCAGRGLLNQRVQPQQLLVRLRTPLTELNSLRHEQQR